MTKRIMIGVAILASTLLLFSPTHSKADTLTFNLDFEFSEGTQPAGPSPWLTATFDDIDSDTVKLTMSGALNGPGEFVGTWLFNYSGNVSALKFRFDDVNSTGPEAKVYNESDKRKAAGDRKFDIEFDFAQREDSRFMDSDIVIYFIDLQSESWSGVQSFNVLSDGKENKESYHTAAHIQGIDNPNTERVDTSKSGWIGDGASAPVPEPATMFLLGSGLIGIGVFVRRRFKK